MQELKEKCQNEEKKTEILKIIKSLKQLNTKFVRFKDILHYLK